MADAGELTLRELDIDDWRALRELRLHALATEPGLFFRHYDEEVGRSDDHWVGLAVGDDEHQLFGIVAAARLVALSGVSLDPDDVRPGTAKFGMTFVLPEYRRRGLAARLFEARMAWVRERPDVARIVVGHRGSNEASRRAVERAGFVRTARYAHRWPDGSDDDNVVYEFDVAARERVRVAASDVAPQ